MGAIGVLFGAYRTGTTGHRSMGRRVKVDTSIDWRDRVTVGIPEAAVILGVSRSTGYAGAKAKQIPTIKVGGCLLVPVAALKKILGLAA
jgi:excisionase family DNA binding protein